MDVHELDTFIKEYQYESDRALVTLAMAYLDTHLTNLIKKFLINDERFIDDFVVGDSQNSIADNFAKRVTLAFVMGILRIKEFQDLNIIRKIHKDFTRNLALLTFDDEEVKKKCADLIIAKDIYASPAHKGKYKDTARLRFVITLGVLGHYLSYRADKEVRHREVFPSYE